jgi:hypothetical protein
LQVERGLLFEDSSYDTRLEQQSKLAVTYCYTHVCYRQPQPHAMNEEGAVHIPVYSPRIGPLTIDSQPHDGMCNWCNSVAPLELDP